LERETLESRLDQLIFDENGQPIGNPGKLIAQLTPTIGPKSSLLANVPKQEKGIRNSGEG
jgi:hypothetical protein